MKKRDLYKLTLLGLSSGLMMLSQNTLSGYEDNSPQDMQNLLAKPSCKAADGCGAPGEDSEEEPKEDQKNNKKPDDAKKSDSHNKKV